jgi:hypothetical protein
MIKGLGSFCLIKNEATFIKAHLKSWLPHLEQMVFFDGDSTDGTLEAIKDAQRGEFGARIKLYEHKDPTDLTEDYQRLSNEAMWALDTDLAIFLHPDMFYMGGKPHLPEGTIAATTSLRSYAGNPGDVLYEISGRGQRWKNIYRLRNPDLGAHYFGTYGAHNEDTYFSEITGDKHEHFGEDFARYPYQVVDSGLLVAHYSDVRTPARRFDRMVKCLINQGKTPEAARVIAPQHPRVSLRSGNGFTFTPVEPPVVLDSREEL